MVFPGSGGRAAESSRAGTCKIKLDLAERIELRGIYRLDQNQVGYIPAKFETRPGTHQLEVWLAGRPEQKEKFSCAAGEEKFILVKARRPRDPPEWVEQGSRFQEQGKELVLEGQGVCALWGKNPWVQVMLADLRGRMDLMRILDTQSAALRRDYSESQGYQVQAATRAVTMFSWDAGTIAAGFKVEDRWLSPKGELYSRVSLRVPRSVLNARGRGPSCADKPRLVFFEVMADKKLLDQVALFCEQGGSGFADWGQALEDGGGAIWDSKELISAPSAAEYCVVDIQRYGRCTRQGMDYIESIGLYQYPDWVPVGQLHKDFTVENTGGCDLR